MKLTAKTVELTQALQLAAHVAASRSASLAAGGVLLRATGEQLKVLATDLEIGVCAAVAARIEQDGVALVPARLLLDVVRLAPTSELRWEVNTADTAEITSGPSKVRLRTMRAEDFPAVAEKLDANAVALPGERLASAIAQVARSVSRDETRPLLTGILVGLEQRTLRLVATDSYRLGVSEAELATQPGEAFQATIPARALAEVARLVQQSEAKEVRLSRAEHRVTFAVDGTVLSTRLLDGHFPDYRQLLPKETDHELRLVREELLDVVRRVSLVAQKNAPLALSLKEGELTLRAQTPDVGEASETLPADFHGEPFEIGFNPAFLRDGLEGADSPDVLLRLLSPLRPGVIESSSDGESRFLYLVMPVRLGA
jgi:DNA polymerase-3 subunit beta